VNSHNTKPERAANDDSVRIETGTDSVRVLQLDLIEANDLAVADDVNPGGDPYNSTGQHVIIKSKIDLED
jgi:hypothetical protein